MNHSLEKNNIKYHIYNSTDSSQPLEAWNFFGKIPHNHKYKCNTHDI